jgi:hypothetical protein
MLLSEMVKPSNCIAEGPGIADVFPGQSGEAGCDCKVSSCKSPSLPAPKKVLTAKRRDGSVHGLDKHTFAIDLALPLTGPSCFICLPLFPLSRGMNRQETYLITSLTIEQDPTQFNYFCRIFCDVDAMFVACRRNMDDDVSIELGDWSGWGRHAGLARDFGTDDQVSLR